MVMPCPDCVMRTSLAMFSTNSVGVSGEVLGTVRPDSGEQGIGDLVRIVQEE